VLTQLVQARLLTVEQRGQERWVEVAHEALLRKWPLLRQWLDEAREFLIGSQHLEPDLREWQAAASGQQSSCLLTGLKLTRAQSWLQERPRQLSPDLRRFIEASLAHRDRLLRRQRRSQRLIVGGLSLLTLVAGGAWFWAQLRNRAAYEAQTRQFQSVHLSMLELDPLASLVHGLAAMGRLGGNLNEALPLAISLDHAAQQNTFLGRRLSGHDEVWSLAVTPAGRLISGGRDGILRFWSSDGKSATQTIRSLHTSGIRGIVSISEQELWTAGDEANLQHWVNGKRQGAAIATGHGSIQTLVHTLDGNLLSAGSDGLLRRWDAKTGQALGPPLRTGHLEVWSVAVLPNGDWVTGGREGKLQWWHQGQRRGTSVPSGQGAVSALVALPNGEVISGGDDGSMRRWDSNNQPQQLTRSGHSSIFTLLWRKDGTVLIGGSERLAAGQDNFIRIWAGEKAGSTGLIQAAKMESLSIIELCNGDLISGGSDGALHHWRSNRKLGNPIQTEHRRVYALTGLPSGDLVSGGDDGSFQIWRNGHLVTKRNSDQGGVTSLMARSDGSFLSGGRDGSIKQWSTNGRLRPENTIQTRHGAVWAMASLPNGDLLSGGDDGSLRLWRRGLQVGRAIKTPHTTVVSLVVRRNGDWVTGGSGGDIQLWRRGKPLGDYFHVASGTVWSLAELRNGSLISANGDGTLFVYPTSAQAITRACRQLQHAGLVTTPNDPAQSEARKLCTRIKS
jgi:WD40 repeat protein